MVYLNWSTNVMHAFFFFCCVDVWTPNLGLQLLLNPAYISSCKHLCLWLLRCLLVLSSAWSTAVQVREGVCQGKWWRISWLFRKGSNISPHCVQLALFLRDSHSDGFNLPSVPWTCFNPAAAEALGWVWRLQRRMGGSYWRRWALLS